MIRTRKLLFGSTMLAGLLASASVFAQTTTPPQPPTPTPAQRAATPQAGESAPVVVVTGSRVRRSTTFTAPAPVSVITHEQAELSGYTDITQILQLSAVAESGAQINNQYGAFVGFAGGPGSNTVALRGAPFGAQRTLVLLNGERVGPAGVGGLVGPVDLSTIPQSIIDHIEILKDGASSIYGSDAIAGVVNIITKTNENGEDIHVYDNTPQQPGGASWEVNGDVGRTWDRGYLTAGFDYFVQKPLTYADRSYLDCSRDLFLNAATHQPDDTIDPSTGKPKCFNEFLTPGVEDAADGLLYAGAPGSPGGPLTPPGFAIVGTTGPGSEANIPFNPPDFNQSDAISALTRYTFTLFGGFDITPHNQFYGSLLLNQRDSEQMEAAQFFVVPANPAGPFNPGFFFPIPVIPEVEPQSQTVNYARAVLGFKGDLPNFFTFTNVQYDIYGQAALSDGSYTTEYEKTDRVNATAGAGAGTNGCDVNATLGSGETMAQAEPGVACVPINYFAAAQNGAFTPQEAAFLFSSERGHTTYNQEYLEGTLTADVYQLPAGPLGASLGFHVRNDEIDDQPGPDAVARNVYNQSTTGVTKGSESVYEGFGELDIPVAKDLPLVHSLDFDLSGRVSDYESFGTDETYKITGKWALTNWVAVRGTWGTAFRAPDLFELFLADQIGFLNQFGTDPCVNYLTSGNPTLIKNCAAPVALNGGVGIPTSYAGAGEGMTVLSGGGAANHLEPETARTETIGLVFTPTMWGQSLNFAVDYYSFDIKNEIAQFGAGNILFQCYTSLDFPNNPFCKLFNRFPVSSSNFPGVETIDNNYVNIGRQIQQGVDVSVSYTTRLPWESKLTVTSELDWTLYETQTFLGLTLNNFPLGEVAQPRFVGNVDARFDHGPWTFNWLLNMIGPTSDYPFITDVFVDPSTGLTDVYAHASTPFYTTSNVSIQRRFDKFSITVGVNNVFDQSPPPYSDTGFQNRVGTTPILATQYDLLGRAFFVSLDAKY
jgi:iron complex outermembrane recepter protein